MPSHPLSHACSASVGCDDGCWLKRAPRPQSRLTDAAFSAGAACSAG